MGEIDGRSQTTARILTWAYEGRSRGKPSRDAINGTRGFVRGIDGGGGSVHVTH